MKRFVAVPSWHSVSAPEESVGGWKIGREGSPGPPAALKAGMSVLQEGEVGAGDDIVKITDGPERISVADVEPCCLYRDKSSEQLQRALRIPALTKGWQSSFQAVFQQDLSSKLLRRIRHRR